MPAKKQPLKLQAPPSDSESEDEGKQLEIAISPVTTVSAVTTATKSSESSASSTSTDDDDDDEEIDLVNLVSKIQDDIRSEIKEVQKEIASLMEIVEQKKQQIKEKTKTLKLWDKRVNTPTTVEIASLAVKVKDNDRQLHSDQDGSLYYKSGTKKQYIKVSAVKVSTKSVRDAGKLVLDGKEAKVHIKDPTVTLSDLEAVEEAELVAKFTAMSSSNI